MSTTPDHPMTETAGPTVCAVIASVSGMVCGEPAPYREGMCEHEHLRTGPLCDRHAEYCLCRVCYLHPEHPHKCVVRSMERSRP